MSPLIIYHAGIVFFRLKDWPGYYISRGGQVLASKRKRLILTQRLQNKGYLRVMLHRKGAKVKKVTVHRLVALTFLDQPAARNQVNHKDGCRQHNHVTNLEWIDNRGNTRHAREMKLIRHGQHRLPFYG